MSNNNGEVRTHAMIKQYRFDGIKRAEEELIRIYGERYVHYRREIRLASEMKYEPDFPIYIMMEQTYRCNLRCISCIHGYPEKRKQYDMNISCMPWELYERIVLEGEEHRCPSISTHNNDEPLLVKDIDKRIVFARKHGFMDVIMTTNGVLFTEDKIKQVIDAGITKILFSIDALTEKTYNVVRPGGDLHKVLNALDYILDYREKNNLKLPIVRVSFVPNIYNQHELKPFIEKFSTIVDYIDVQPFCTYYDENTHLIPDGAVHVSGYRCSSPFYCSIVRANGDVLVCPNFYGTERVIGNIYKKPLYEIFNTDNMKRLRQQFKQGIYEDPICAQCVAGIYVISTEMIENM